MNLKKYISGLLLSGIILFSCQRQPVQQAQIGRHPVQVVDLKALGITDYGSIKSYGFSRPWANSWLEAFVDGEPLHRCY